MREIRYADEGMDMKKFVLFFLQKSWMLLAAAVIGATVGSVVYIAAHTVPESEREYQAVSKVYLDFAPDETGEIYQQYNGYTWNDLMATDPYMEPMLEELPEDYTREEVTAAVKAEILSDLRLLTVTVTTHDAKRCDAILRAAGQVLEMRGETDKEFRRIRVIQTTEAQQVTADARTVQAALVGLVLAVAAALIGILLFYVLDDRIFVAGDLKRVTELPFIGYVGADGEPGRDYERNLAYLRQNLGKVTVLDVMQNRGSEPKAPAVEPGKKAAASQAEAVTAWQEAAGMENVIIVVPYGGVHAVYLAYAIEQLKVRGCSLAGTAVSGADNKFLGRYYGRMVSGRG